MPGLSVMSALIARSVKRAVPIAQLYAEGNMTCRVRIVRPAKNTFSRDTGKMTNPDDATVTDDCPARIYTVDGGQTFNLGDEPVYYANTYCSIPVARPRPWVNDEVIVLSAPDPDLVGRHFRITGMYTGGTLPAVHRAMLSGAEPAPNVALR